MARKRELDKLSLDMIQCVKDGFGCHYGKWKAKQADGAVERRLPDGWKICEWCGESFRPNKSNQRFCGYSCQRKAADKRHRENASERQKAYRERKKEGAA